METERQYDPNTHLSLSDVATDSYLIRLYNDIPQYQTIRAEWVFR